MDSLLTDSRYFAQITLPSDRNATQINWEAGVTKENVVAAIRSRLGPDFVLGGTKDPKPTGLALYDTLTELLPLRSSQMAYFWKRTGPCFASMLETTGFSLSTQAGYLIWFYARVIGFLGPEDGPVRSIVTYDGSPIEWSWQFSQRNNAAPGDFKRKLRFCIEPLDPRDGTPLPINAVLKYLASPLGNLGIVQCPDEWLEWSIKSEEYLFPNCPRDVSPKGSRFIAGFDLNSDCTLTLKAYFLTPSRPVGVSPSENKDTDGNFPVYCGDTDFRPWLPLISQLDPTMVKPFNDMIDYFESLPDHARPKFQMMSLDCVPSKQNRMKIYPAGVTGTAWSDAKELFTLGGRLSDPEMPAHLARLELLWNELFPYATSAHNLDIVEPALVGLKDAKVAEEDPTKEYAQHPQGGLYTYYEFAAGKAVLATKFYVPVRYYGKDDHFTAQAVERFYRKQGIEAPPGSETGFGWLPRQIAKAFKHRPLEERSGMQTFVTYGAKPEGWEVTNYITPELWG